MTPVAQSVQAAPSGPAENPTMEVAAEHRAKAARVAAWTAVVLRPAAIPGRVDVAVPWVPPSRSTPLQMLPSLCWGLRWPSSFAIAASVTDSSDDDATLPSRALDTETLLANSEHPAGTPPLEGRNRASRCETQHLDAKNRPDALHLLLSEAAPRFSGRHSFMCLRPLQAARSRKILLSRMSRSEGQSELML
jgi:hypothetical protein